MEPIPVAKPNTPEVEPAAPVSPPAARTNAFSSGSSAKPTADLPARQVQTGGFGDPFGARGEGRPDKVTNIASLGSFDLPTGTGAGNGSGNSNGTRGVVVSAGFGNGMAGPGNRSGAGRTGGGVKQAGFGDSRTAAAVPRKGDEGPPNIPVEILSKPRPDYTDEARKLRIEGEVLLRALFTAAGEVRVLEILSGLGHGLDENARRAAQQVRFKPAQRNGQSIDSIATIHINFQLAY